MIVILSCAKRQRQALRPVIPGIKPLFQSDAQEWIQRLSRCSPEQLAQILCISPKLAMLNYHRYQDACKHPEQNNPALDTFDGDVYQAMGREEWSETTWEHAQKHLRILSGLYGYLRPHDPIAQYRLEMQTRLPWINCPLALHWQNRLTTALNNESSDTIINLASLEYSRAIHRKKITKRLIDIVFWDKKKDSSYAVIGLKSKKARGHMIKALCTQGWTDTEDLKKFTHNYRYNPSHSTENVWVFTSL